jgi:glycosyltransferase involved in cell wall biosynthesis
MKKRILAIYSVKKFYINDGKFWTEGGFGQYVKAISPYFEKIVLCIHAKKASKNKLNGFYTIDLPNIEYRILPWYDNELQCLFKLPGMILKALWFARDTNVINARVPDYSGICGALAAKLFRKPLFFNVVDDWAEEAEFPATRLKGIMKKGLIAHLKLYVKIEKVLLRKSLAFIQGASVYKRYSSNPKAKLVVSTSINEEDICSQRIGACEKTPITLLSVGRLQREKGHIYLLEAFDILRKTMSNIQLRIVGEGNLRDTFLNWIEEHNFKNDIELPGVITHGPKLFEIYRKADIFILPSISEGTPKVILEAMANGLPVIATAVGGVPTIISHRVNGYLVPRQNKEAIAEGILEIIANEVLRKNVVAAGYRTAMLHTNQIEIKRIIDAVKDEYPQLFSQE